MPLKNPNIYKPGMVFCVGKPRGPGSKRKKQNYYLDDTIVNKYGQSYRSGTLDYPVPVGSLAILLDPVDKHENYYRILVTGRSLYIQKHNAFDLPLGFDKP